MRSVEAQARGVLGTLRSGHVGARALAVADSRAWVRSVFLASAVRTGLLRAVAVPRSLVDLAASTACTRPERLEAWLSVGVELGELRRDGDRYVARGRRARALAAGDPLLEAHYRSMLDYQAGPYDELDGLLQGTPGSGRDDLERHADVIAQVSLAASPFVVPFLAAVVDEIRPARVLDVGCGTGVYMAALLDADPRLEVDGIDLAVDVVAKTRDRLEHAGVADRARVHVGDVRAWTPTPGAPAYDLVTMLNVVYYFPSTERRSLYGRIRSLVGTGGELVIVTMTRTGSIASAHLHFMLSCEAGATSLPEGPELASDLADAGYELVEQQTLVPTEPFIAIRARCP